ncbi:MmcQ/YjbR family DNA-binding protein [Kineococcus sp. NUM-3379]
MTDAELRELALGLPGAEEVETWDHPTFRVRGKIFAISGRDGTSVKASREDQAALVAQDPATFAPAPHVGRYGWVLVRLDRVDPEEMRELVVDAWRRTAPRVAVSAYDAQTPAR